MKRRIVLIFAAVVVVVGAGLAIGEDEKKDRPKRDKGKQVQGEKRTRPARGERRDRGPRGVGAEDRAGRRGRGPEAFGQQMEQRGKRHKAEMKQLAKIKDMAVKEKASKTAEMIQKLIDKKQAAFDVIVKQSEERRERFMKMMEERGGAAGERGGRGRRGPRPDGERGNRGRGRGGEKVENDVEKVKD